MATRRLITERLVLRPPEPGDAAALTDGLNDRAVARWLTSAPYPYAIEDAQAFIARNAGRPGVWVISGPEGVMGVISLSPGTGLGYWLARAHWGHGFMTEAVRTVIDARMDVTDLPLLSGYHPGNEPSRAILLGQGFVQAELVEVHGARGAQTIQRMRLTSDAWRFARDPRIETQRLVMSPLMLADAEEIVAMASDLEVAKMLATVPHPFSVAQARAWIGDNRWRGKPGFRWAIRRQADGALLGMLALGGGTMSMTQIGAQGRTQGRTQDDTGDIPNFACWLGRAHWGQGYATEAAQGFMADMLPRLRLAAVTADVFEENAASHRIMEKLGFTRSGIQTGTSAARLEPAPVVTYRMTTATQGTTT